MVKVLRFLPLLFVLSLTLPACEETSTTPPEEKPVTLDITSKLLPLSATDSVASSSMTLSCGCGFLLDSVHYTGDTSVIHFTSRDTLSRARATQVVTASVRPSGLPLGSHYAGAIDFIVFHTYHGVSYVYYDTIRAVLN